MRALLAIWIAAIAGCGGSTPDPAVDASTAAPDAAPRQIVMEGKSLLVGELAESILTGGPSDPAIIRLSAPRATLDWNIHGHVGGGTQTVKEELGVMTASYVFTPPAQGEWFLLLRNKDPSPMTIEVQIELYGDLQWSGWQ